MKTLVKTKCLLDCTGNDCLENGWFVFEDGVIRQVGGRGEPCPGGGYEEVLDVSDKCVTAGLIDAHIHLGLSHIDRINPMPVMQQMAEPGQWKICRAVLYLRQHLDAGVTTARTMGEEHLIDIDLRRAINEGYVDGPRLICAGNVITASHGQAQIGISVADGVEEVRKACRKNLAVGADFIKIFVGGGVVGNETGLGFYSYNYDEIRTAVLEAEALGKYTAVHVHAGPGLDMSLAAGVGSIEHACLATDEQIEKMVKAGVWITGTFSPALHPMGVHSIPEDNQRRLREAQAKIMEVYGKLYKSGAKMCFGTDGVHGAIAFEAQRFEDCGASRMDCLLAITREAAKACRVADKVGTIEPGKYADFTVLEGCPLDDLGNLEKVCGTYIGGVKK